MLLLMKNEICSTSPFPAAFLSPRKLIPDHGQGQGKRERGGVLGFEMSVYSTTQSESEPESSISPVCVRPNKSKERCERKLMSMLWWCRILEK
jgi:hypothetical protein